MVCSEPGIGRADLKGSPDPAICSALLSLPVSPSPGSWEGMQNLKPHPGPTGSDSSHMIHMHVEV